MRYFTTIVVSAQGALAFYVWGVWGLPWVLLLLASSFSALLGCGIGYFWSSALRRHLLDHSANVMTREVPWAPIVFGLASLLIGAGALVLSWLMPTIGLIGLRVAAVAWGALCIGLFATIAITVRRLEKDRGSDVLIVPGGLSFDE